MARYRQLAEKCIQDIQAGKLTSGDRILSLRQFAQQHGISVSTAVSCYAELESQGWLMARPQAGFFIAEPSHVIPAPNWPTFQSRVTSPTTLRSRSDELNGPLGTAHLALDKTARQALDRSLRRAMKRAAHTLTQYPVVQGEPPLLSALANHFTQGGFALKGEELVITHGCMDAVKTALEVCTRPGDTVAVSSPCYNGLLDLLSQLSLDVVEIPSCTEGIDLDQFEQHLESGQLQAGLFCTTHMNPQGITLTPAQKKRLARLANHYRVPVIEDDVYLELTHHTPAPLPTAYHDEGGFVLWCGSVSKTLSPSYRLGWCRPGRFFQAYLKRALGVPTLIQCSVADFIDSGAYASHLKRTRHQLRQHKAHYLNVLSEHLPVGSRVTQPDGGLVLWIEVPGLDAKALGKAAEQVRLDIRIGPWFTESSRYRNCLRLNIGLAPDEMIEKELARLMKLIALHCSI
ncbi:PLP-dependent aminotransferase family protein [Cobetia amphilecti]|uniref:PLP-dependent aminotransferase family protein n=1 Tax=Cobetia amphilecti TaxID=1055104 RepID=A0AAP4TZP4_9GAMM|nr:PLP-dependent aminotransferase family protein [Cobetia amphilecti]MDO6673155.1 PLP-dependent aminotransferase family protein [Cobetia amphilecti]MDO6817200.1 PLP-dependent aminotransferase family protein [Cobetia amphilecti]